MGVGVCVWAYTLAAEDGCRGSPSKVKGNLVMYASSLHLFCDWFGCDCHEPKEDGVDAELIIHQ